LAGLRQGPLSALAGPPIRRGRPKAIPGHAIQIRPDPQAVTVAGLLPGGLGQAREALARIR